MRWGRQYWNFLNTTTKVVKSFWNDPDLTTCCQWSRQSLQDLTIKSLSWLFLVFYLPLKHQYTHRDQPGLPAVSQTHQLPHMCFNILSVPKPGGNCQALTPAESVEHSWPNLSALISWSCTKRHDLKQRLFLAHVEQPGPPPRCRQEVTQHSAQQKQNIFSSSSIMPPLSIREN